MEVGYLANTPDFVEEGRVTEITVTLEVAPAAGESFEFALGFEGPSIQLGEPAVTILNAGSVDCREIVSGLLDCELSSLIDGDATPPPTASSGFTITLSTALEAVDDDSESISLLLRPQDPNPHFEGSDLELNIRNVSRIQFSADPAAASAAWGDSHFTLTLDLDTAAGEASTTNGTLTFAPPSGSILCEGFGFVVGGSVSCSGGTLGFNVEVDDTSVPLTVSLAATHIGQVFTVSFTPPDTHDLGARAEFELTVARATLRAVRPASPTVATEGGAAVELMWRRIGGGVPHDPITAPVQFRISNGEPPFPGDRGGWIITGAAPSTPAIPDNCGIIPSGIGFQQCRIDRAWSASEPNPPSPSVYVVGVRVTADLVNEEFDHTLTMALESTNLDTARYEVITGDDAAVVWVAENVDVVVTPHAATNTEGRARAGRKAGLCCRLRFPSASFRRAICRLCLIFKGRRLMMSPFITMHRRPLNRPGRLRQLSGDHSRGRAIHRCAGVGDYQCRSGG